MSALPDTMRGAVLLGPEQLEVRDVPVPRPGPGELLLRVGAATTCGTDVKVYRRGGHPRMLQVPTLFGHEMAGHVAAVGAGVDDFRPGEAVVVANSAACGVCAACGVGRENLCEDLHYLNGAFAEYVAVPARFLERSVHRVPEGLALEEAALAEPLACVLHGIAACDLDAHAGAQAAEVLLFGAGPIGLLFVAALARDGHRVIVADPNPARLEVATQMGAARVLPIERGGGQTDRVIGATRAGRGADVAVDCSGVPEVWSDALGSVHPGGLVCLFGGCAPGTTVPLDTHQVHYSELTVKGVYHHRPASFRAALGLLADPDFPARALLTDRQPIERTETALRSMMDKRNLKVVIQGTSGARVQGTSGS